MHFDELLRGTALLVQALFLASKMEETHRRLRDIITTVPQNEKTLLKFITLLAASVCRPVVRELECRKERGGLHVGAA